MRDAHEAPKKAHGEQLQLERAGEGEPGAAPSMTTGATGATFAPIGNPWDASWENSRAFEGARGT